ncbi:sigma-70 family RNA polymerase sigma factor [Agrobacterium sp. SHOUNA12C]|uniref:RNA polymerase ECF subfamily sigma factor n=1 Tax=Rhizobium rhizogenes NBRC 13257 TaxID=1220581 RepID=A0AA87U7L9_RHIRH|nr:MULTISPECIES: sigma-70 family RNA polymerase sigma factor [Rhizobium]MCJ9724278.1 sigma-70 family RNA polymerase sigma factor [Agrobacterium sp. BETTINA12B]MCJ9761341.1 sigma-70 family RNA polymerase sigma factor [Agrobacterium sp. SHOUNA12C]EJK80635.1 RNA polymerase sigma factor, sigma-70 family [Rhizobium sp. AP16]NTF49800.1 sigma-70 family RNA polymerase sigma factor [Rhizobium rhizogenes]NTF56427.1 sigma-70 family RNA polymerase sigma factor [Rhizobium rhizogenes]
MERNKRTFDVLGQLGSLRRYARSLVRNADEAEDLVHDALVKAYERKASFRRGANLRTWLLSILHNAHIDRLRQKRSLNRRHEEAAVEFEPALPASQDHAVRLSQVRDAFFNLPEEQREALHLVAIEDLSYQEAASALGIPMGTLMSRIARARASLRSFEETAPKISHLRLIDGGGNENN